MPRTIVAAPTLRLGAALCCIRSNNRNGLTAATVFIRAKMSVFHSTWPFCGMAMAAGNGRFNLGGRPTSMI
jgi:hypothetical protein